MTVTRLGINSVPMKKEMTASACLKENTRLLQVASWNNDGTTQMYGCECYFEIKNLP